MRNVIYIGGAMKFLQRLPDNSVHCIVTSPPYYGLRDYQVTGQLGLEDSPDAYIEKLVAIFREARRVLRADGTCWLNLGDSYARNPAKVGVGHAKKGKQATNADSLSAYQSPIPIGLKEKDLMMIPARVAIALQADGWYLRSDIIWHKNNPMPESVTDRPTNAHEHVFLLTKSAKYFYDADAIREPAISGLDLGILRGSHAGKINGVSAHAPSILKRQQAGIDSRFAGSGQRNKRNVWTINTKGFSEAHFAVMPTELAETCIKAGCPENVCSKCGAGYVRVVEKGERLQPVETRDRGYPGTPSHIGALVAAGGDRYMSGRVLAKHRVLNPDKLLGFKPLCDCNADTQAGVVLDMFGGAGTSAVAAVNLERDYLLGELSLEYVGIAQKRIQATRRGLQNADPTKPTILSNGIKQLSLFSEGMI